MHPMLVDIPIPFVFCCTVKAARNRKHVTKKQVVLLNQFAIFSNYTLEHKSPVVSFLPVNKNKSAIKTITLILFRNVFAVKG